MSRPDGASEAAKPGRRPPRRLVRARHRLRADLVQLLGAAAGLVMGLTIPRVGHGPTVDGGRLAELLFTLGIGVVGVMTVVFSLLFGVVQWSSSSFSPRLGLFREDPLVWRTFGFGIGVFVFSVTAGLSSANAGRVSLLVPLTAVLAVLIALLAIRALQARAFLSMQLPLVLAAVAARGRAVIGDLYPLLSEGAAGDATPAEAPPGPSRTVAWPGAAAVVQQLNLRRLVHEAARANVLVVFRVSVGDSLHEAAPLADVHGGDLPDRVVRAAVVRGVERSFEQDPMLAFRLLADIGLRALSPAVNDPATAVDAMEATEGLLRALARRELRLPDVADRASVPRVRLVLPTWEDYLRTGVEDLLPFAATVPMVLERVQRLLTNLLEMSPPARHAPLLRLAEQVQDSLAACRSVDPKPRRAVSRGCRG